MKSSRTWISIHAPREGGDNKASNQIFDKIISIHAPREGGDIIYQKKHLLKVIFQSTPPARGATFSVLKIKPTMALFQSTPPARGATWAWFHILSC